MDQIQDLSQNEINKKFLIHINCQEFNINDKPINIIFLKDVTFGVLLEQVKASEQLKNIINNLINKRIGDPL